MNIIFTIITILSVGTITILSPKDALPAMLSGGEKAFELSIKLLITYSVWLGIFEILKKSGLASKFASLLKPVNKKLFGTLPGKSGDYVSMNISANILGISGATTPMGILAIKELEKYPNTHKQIATFFVVNATSIQLIPSSILALRTSMNSAFPSDIIVPTILATLLSFIVGIILVKVFVK